MDDDSAKGVGESGEPTLGFSLNRRLFEGFFRSGHFASLILHLSSEGAGGGVAFGAHVGGSAAGALAMWIMRRSLLASDLDKPAVRPARVAASIQEQINEPATVYLSIDGQQLGPYAPSKVRAMVALGSVSPDAYFWQDGMIEWRPVGEL